MKLGKEAALGLFLVAALAGGSLFDLTTDPVKARTAPQAASLFDQRSVYCPPPPRDSASAQAVLGAANGEQVPIGVGDKERLELPADRLLTLDTTGSTDVIGLGTEVVASSLATFEDKVEGLGAARCSKTASTRWYFAEGSSALGAEQRLVIYNPFPDEAVVGVSLYTPEGEQGNASLAEGVAVPAGETRVIRINEFIRQERFVGSLIVANRGRVIAWRALEVNGEERPEGVQFTLGATAPASAWYFPEGGVGGGLDERVSLLNPTEEEAVATVSLVTDKETIQPPKLVEVVVPPRTLLPLPLADYVGGADSDVGGAGVVVRTSSGELIAERSVYYDTDDLKGVASEVGSPRTSTEWFVGPAVAESDVDSLVVMNPGAEDVQVSLSLLSADEDPNKPGKLQDLKVRAGGRLKIKLADWTKGEIYGVLLESDGEVVAERVAASSGDVASVMGIPLVVPAEL